MIKCNRFIFSFLFLSTIMSFNLSYASKIVGLVQVRNEEDIIGTCLKALALYTDAIVVFLDGSTDRSTNIIKSLQKELKIEAIIEEQSSGWQYRTEAANRNRLIKAARAIGGTHFICLDADEILSAQCAKNNWLRNKLLSMRKGELLHLTLLNLWKGFKQYRADRTGGDPSMVYCSVLMCDDGNSLLDEDTRRSPNGFIHVGRLPGHIARAGKDLHMPKEDLKHVVIHLAYVDWDYYLTKRAWYLCLEKIRLGQFPQNNNSVKKINELYSKRRFFDPTVAILKPVDPEWLNYGFFDENIYFKRTANWRKQQLHDWFKQYGMDFFNQLDFMTDPLQLINNNKA
ncbi:MAG TPA: glycosyltransferase family A protein [Candidatus Babeliales bacterium]|nr:glycosyltransferase family A protein [Candidatus Babeliales bacterium]